MWPETNATSLLGIRYPIVLAGMAGGVTTPELVAAVSNAGGLGTLGAGYLNGEQIRTAVQAIRKLTDRPFAVNLFVPERATADDDLVEAMQRSLETFRKELGIERAPVVSRFAESFEEQLTAVVDERVPVFSFTFGIPDGGIIKDLKRRGVIVVGTATTPAEAVALEESGVDAIVAQGSEAGGHRGTFIGPSAKGLIGTIALVPKIVDQTRLPVIAAGGITDGRGIAAALMLGAAGVQMGTAFLTCPESGAHPRYKEAILTARGESTVLTSAFSGKLARGIENRFIRELSEQSPQIPPYPIQNALTRDIRQAAGKQNRPEFMSLWSGQGATSRELSELPAADLVARLANQVTSLLQHDA